jgi:hypothetical protein
LGAAAHDLFVRPGAQHDLKDMNPDEKGISREEQLRRMNIVANEFNYYAADKPDQKYLNHRTPKIRPDHQVKAKTKGFCMVL